MRQNAMDVTRPMLTTTASSTSPSPVSLFVTARLVSSLRQSFGSASIS